jgi:hypothetical protein
MFLYTIVPIEVIFGDDPETNPSDYRENTSRSFEINYYGRNFLAQSLSNGRLKIDRLLSTDPQDFLNPDWQPGSIF